MEPTSGVFGAHQFVQQIDKPNQGQVPEFKLRDPGGAVRPILSRPLQVPSRKLTASHGGMNIRSEEGITQAAAPRFSKVGQSFQSIQGR